MKCPSLWFIQHVETFWETKVDNEKGEFGVSLEGWLTIKTKTCFLFIAITFSVDIHKNKRTCPQVKSINAQLNNSNDDIRRCIGAKQVRVRMGQLLLLICLVAAPHVVIVCADVWCVMLWIFFWAKYECKLACYYARKTSLLLCLASLNERETKVCFADPQTHNKALPNKKSIHTIVEIAMHHRTTQHGIDQP
jgi:hypothetical protein